MVADIKDMRKPTLVNWWYLAWLPLCFLPGLTQASDLVFQTEMETSSWQLAESTKLRCSLEHPIAGFGKAVFYQQSGRPLKLRFISAMRFQKGLEARFRSVSAAWNPRQTAADLDKVSLSDVNPMADIDAEAARYAWFQLQQGYSPGLFFMDDALGYQTVAVMLSPVNFLSVQSAFNDCVSQLYRDNFYDVRTAVIYFGSNQEFPAEGAEERALKPLLDYLSIDPSIKRITITGRTDDKGARCYNKVLSRRRAEYVFDYLVLSGIDPQMIDLSSAGEERPLKKGKDNKSRAANRSVVVQLKR